MLTDVTSPVAPALPTARVTTAAFEAFIALPENSERLFELIDGEIVEKAMPTDEHGTIDGWIVYFLNDYLIRHSDVIGRVVVNGRYRPTGAEDQDRLPDVAIIIGDIPITRRGVADFMPTICVETQSPDDRLPAMRTKASFYLANGARYALIVIPGKRIIEVYTPEDEVTVLKGDDPLTFPDLLPGFSVPIAKLFPPAP